jgi:Flp pilus assembly protein TadG
VSATRQKRDARARGDRGSALVEAALILPVVALMVFGIVEIGFLFRSATIVSTSTRNGARLASAQYGGASGSTAQANVMNEVRLTVEKDLGSRAGVDRPVSLWIYRANSSGKPPSGNFTSCGSPCYVYNWNSATGHFALASGAWASPDACGITKDSVGVFVKATHSPVGFGSTFGAFTIAENTVMRLEPAISATCPTG